MISHKNKCIFIHIPKVAGQSIEKFFLNLNNLDWDTRHQLLLKRNIKSKKGPPRLAHLKSEDYLSHQYISPYLFKEYFKFTFVRNPWSRAVSFYKYGRFNEIMSFKKFVEKLLPKLIHEKKWFYGPQYNFIYIENRLKVDFVGHFENLNDDFGKVCKKLDIPFIQLPHHNKSVKEKGLNRVKYRTKKIINNPVYIFNLGKDQINSKDYRTYYDSSLIKTIEELYYLDVKTFNYNFENTNNKKRYSPYRPIYSKYCT